MTTRAICAFPVATVLAGFIAAGCGRQRNATGGGASAPHGGVAGAPPTMRLVSDVSRGEWRMPAGDYGNLRYSALDAIKTTNVVNLHVVTTFSTGVPHGHEGQPLVFGNTMYIVTGFRTTSSLWI